MPKVKIHRGASKRFKKTAAGYKYKHAFKNHLLTKMTTKRKRQLRGTKYINGPDTIHVKRVLRAN